MIVEYIMPFIDGIMDIFTQGGIITYNSFCWCLWSNYCIEENSIS